MACRKEKDSLGEVSVPADKLWGPQTQRSLQNFQIGEDKMPWELISALALIKECCARANEELQLLAPEKSRFIQEAAGEVRRGLWKEHFPLSVWQTGSGTQTNMNVNEVIARRALQLAAKTSADMSSESGQINSGESGPGGIHPNDVERKRASSGSERINSEQQQKPASRESRLSDGGIHPNDDVNKSQSSNDAFPSAMRISLALAVGARLLPALRAFEGELKRKAKDFEAIVKIGRTHLMDAVPLTLGQEFSAFQEQIRLSRERVKSALPHLLLLPIGGTAVGTGLNTAPGFGKRVCELISEKIKEDFIKGGGPAASKGISDQAFFKESAPKQKKKRPEKKPPSRQTKKHQEAAPAGSASIEEFASFSATENKMESIAAHDALIQMSGSLKTLAVSLMKIASDIRLLASGPRCGLGELALPANEPGSSIMPGKVNPTQCEALAMVSAQAMGQDLSAALGGAMGQLQLNTFKPLIIFNLLRSVRLLSDGMNNFRKKCLSGLRANEKKIRQNLQNSLMLATALNPHIGYEKASRAALAAHKNGTSLKEEAVRLGFLTEEEFDRLAQPEKMTRPNLGRPPKSSL